MTDPRPSNEQDVDARDPALERAWRAYSQESPPAALDATILAAAHRAVGSAPKDAANAKQSLAAARAAPRWWMPLAAAAAIGVVAIGVLQVAPQETDVLLPPTVAPAPPSKMSAAPPVVAADSAPQASVTAAPPPVVDTLRKAAPAPSSAPPPVPRSMAPVPPPSAPAQESGRRNEADSLQSMARQTPLPFPAASEEKREAAAPATPPGASRDDRSADRSAVSAPAPTAGMAPPTAPAVGAIASRAKLATAPSASNESRARPADPDAWIAQIRQLRERGELAAAERELREFRRQFADADARLPADLRAWAASIKP